MLITIDNIRQLQAEESVIHRVRVFGKAKNYKGLKKLWHNLLAIFITRSKYRLLRTLRVQLRDGRIVTIPEGFVWDLSSVPRVFWALFPPDGDFEFAAFIHDFLYITKIMSRKRADVEMFAWSKAVTVESCQIHWIRLKLGKWKFQRMIKIQPWGSIDNWIRYAVVRLFGWTVYYRRK